MNTIDFQDKFDELKKYLKYLFLLLPLAIIFLLIRNCGSTDFNDIETELESKALSYIKKNNLNVTAETYIEITKLGEIDGTELCKRASGVIVKNNNGSLEANAYLDCENYQSKIIKNKSKYVVLNGDAIMTLNTGEAFNDPSYYLKKDATVQVSGIVGTAPGIYTLNYNVYVNGKLKETLIRKVIISEADKTATISGIDDKTKPALTLMGDKNMVLGVGSTYKEPGYLAVDYEDGKITRKVKVSGEVNTRVAGIYTITYSITNSRGVTTIAVRKVKVVQYKADLDISLTLENEALTNKTSIILDVDGEGYEETVMPNGVPTNLKKVSYQVTKNGTYTFKIYDRYNNEIKKEIVVENIDDEAPIGSCHAVVTSSKTTIEVTAYDNKGIAGYSYNINGSSTDYKTSNTYEANTKGENVKVSIKDISGNINTVNCTIEEKNIISGGQCGSSNVTVNIKTCFGNQTISSNVPLEDYLVGVLYAEEDPEMTDSLEYIKAFVIFARTFALNRGGYSKSSTLSLRTCDSDQNWCDYDQGCYRYQSDEMFNQCIDFALSRSSYTKDGRPYYNAQDCANRVTTFPGTMNVSNKMYYVNNSAWPAEMDTSAMSNRNDGAWKSKVSGAHREFLLNAVAETAGLVLKTPDGKLAEVYYYMCDRTSHGNTMCPNMAEKLGEQGYTAEEIIKAYTKDYPEIVIECFNK